MQPTQPAPVLRASWTGGAGCIVSTLGDLTAWDDALESGKIVTRADYALMSAPGTLKNGSKTSYGMGLAINRVYGHRLVWHNGASLGSLTMNVADPGDHIDIIVFENDRNGDMDEMAEAVFDALLPDAVAAASRPAADEIPAVRERVLALINQMMHGTMVKSEFSPGFQSIASSANQKQLAYGFAPVGAPTAVIYRGKEDGPKATDYIYRAEFGEYSSLRFVIAIDKTTNLIDGIDIPPWPIPIDAPPWPIP